AQKQFKIKPWWDGKASNTFTYRQEWISNDQFGSVEYDFEVFVNRINEELHVKIISDTVVYFKSSNKKDDKFEYLRSIVGLNLEFVVDEKGKIKRVNRKDQILKQLFANQLKNQVPSYFFQNIIGNNGRDTFVNEFCKFYEPLFWGLDSILYLDKSVKSEEKIYNGLVKVTNDNFKKDEIITIEKQIGFNSFEEVDSINYGDDARISPENHTLQTMNYFVDSQYQFFGYSFSLKTKYNPIYYKSQKYPRDPTIEYTANTEIKRKKQHNQIAQHEFKPKAWWHDGKSVKFLLKYNYKENVSESGEFSFIAKSKVYNEKLGTYKILLKNEDEDAQKQKTVLEHNNYFFLSGLSLSFIVNDKGQIIDILEKPKLIKDYTARLVEYRFDMPALVDYVKSNILSIATNVYQGIFYNTDTTYILSTSKEIKKASDLHYKDFMISTSAKEFFDQIQIASNLSYTFGIKQLGYEDNFKVINNMKYLFSKTGEFQSGEFLENLKNLDYKFNSDSKLFSGKDQKCVISRL
nr:hypothetical protein [Saprospiraceae bacterium]